MAQPGEPNVQPKTIRFGKKTYKLATPFRWVDQSAGINEGPLYKLASDPNAVYLPDAGYLHAHQPLSFMHRISIPN